MGKKWYTTTGDKEEDTPWIKTRIMKTINTHLISLCDSFILFLHYLLCIFFYILMKSLLIFSSLCSLFHIIYFLNHNERRTVVNLHKKTTRAVIWPIVLLQWISLMILSFFLHKRCYSSSRLVWFLFFVSDERKKGSLMAFGLSVTENKVKMGTSVVKSCEYSRKRIKKGRGTSNV